jgi:hypothetical protein
VLVVTTKQSTSDSSHEVRFYDLTHPNRAPWRVPGKLFSYSLAVSPNDGLVASATGRGEVRFFNPAKGELIESVHGPLNAVADIAFSPDGRRLISTFGGREAVKVWDVSTRQELLTLAGTGSYLGAARWSADGDVILAGPPWQAPILALAVAPARGDRQSFNNWHVHDGGNGFTDASGLTHRGVGLFPKIFTGGDPAAYKSNPSLWAYCPNATDKALLHDEALPGENLRNGNCVNELHIILLPRSSRIRRQLVICEFGIQDRLLFRAGPQPIDHGQ